MADRSSRGRISGRDWFADAQRRIQRLGWSPSWLRLRPRSWATAGVVIQRRAARTIQGLRLGRAASRPQARLVLRQPRLQAASDPILTLQSERARQIARSAASPPPATPDESPRPVDHPSVSEPAGPPPPPPARPVLSSVTRAVRRLLGRRQEEPPPAPTLPPPEATPPQATDAGAATPSPAAPAGRSEEEPEPAADQPDRREAMEPTPDPEAILEAAGEEEPPPKPQAEPQGERAAHIESTPPPPPLALRSPARPKPEPATPRALEPEAVARGPVRAEPAPPSREPATGPDARPEPPEPPRLPLVSRLVRRLGIARTVERPEKPEAIPASPPEVSPEPQIDREEVPRRAAVAKEDKPLPAGRPARIDEGEPPTALPPSTTDDAVPSPAVHEGGLLVTLRRFIQRRTPQDEPTPPVRRQPPADEAPRAEAADKGVSTGGEVERSAPLSAPAMPPPSASAPRSDGLLVTLRRLMQRRAPPDEPTPPVERQPPADEAPRVGAADQALSTGREAPPAIRPSAPAMPPPTAGPPRSDGVLVTLRRLVRRQSPPDEPGPHVQRQPQRDEEPRVGAAADVSRPASVGQEEERLTTRDPVHIDQGQPATQHPPSAGESAPAPSPATREGGLLLTLRRLVRREPPEPVAPAAAPTPDLLPQPRGSEAPERPAQPEPPPAPAPPPAAAPPPVPAVARREDDDLGVQPWTPVYRRLPAARPSVEASASRGAASSIAGVTPREPAPPPTAPALDGASGARLEPAPGLPIDTEAAEAYALSRQLGEPVAVQRAAVSGDAPAPEAPADTEAGAAEEEARPASPHVLEKLAHEVYELLRRRLMVERERNGIGSSWF